MNKDSGKRLASGKPQLAGGTPQTPKKKRRRLSWQQIGLIVVIILLAIALLGVVVWKSVFVRPELPSRGDDSTLNADASGQPDSSSSSGIDYEEGIRPRGGDGERKSKDYWTVLILGRDTGGGGNTDTMLLASYDVTNQKATVMSIPRDTMVNIPQDIKRINAVYNYYGGGEKGIQGLYKEIAQLVGFEPDFQVVVEWDAVGEIVDAMGGVYFDVPRNMNYDDPFQDLHIHQTAGYRLLTGSDAMQVLRYRHDNNTRYGYADGDLGRIKTQQAFLTAMVEQLLQFKNMTKINSMIDVFKRNVETDLSFQNILWFAQSAVLGGLKMENVNFVTMPNTPKYVYSRTVGNDQSYVVPNPRELLDLVNNELSPFTEVFTLSDLDIMSVNADGSLRSSTGHVEDSRAAVAPVRPSTSSTPASSQPEDDENDGEEPSQNGTSGTAAPGPAESPGDGGESNNDPNGESNGSSGNGNPIVIDPNDPFAIPPADPGTETDPGTSANPGGDAGTVTPAPDPITEPVPDPTPDPEPVQEPAPAPDPGFTFIELPPAE